jgi:hypothetical protein
MKKFKHKNNGSTMTYKDGCMKIENLVIEGTPNLDYWEEVIEKEWEILHFKNESNNQVYFKNGDYYNTYNSDIGKRNYDYCLKYYSVLSAKNLKTGVEFSIGDKVMRHVDDKCPNPNTEVRLVDKIYSKDCELYFDTIADRNFILSLFSKVKAPLFTTFDGEDIYEYTNRGFVWVIDNKFEYMLPVRDVNVKGSLTTPETYKVFSTKESAEKWVKENTKKPLFTTYDGVDIFEKDETYAVGLDFNVSEKKYFLGTYPNAKYFAEKERAEEYILMNKPLLSINDIIDILDKSNAEQFRGSIPIKALVNFCKNKK